MLGVLPLPGLLIAVAAVLGVACCATDPKLDEMIKTGHFRADLCYRLSEIIINIPLLIGPIIPESEHLSP